MPDSRPLTSPFLTDLGAAWDYILAGLLIALPVVCVVLIVGLLFRNRK